MPQAATPRLPAGLSLSEACEGEAVGQTLSATLRVQEGDYQSPRSVLKCTPFYNFFPLSVIQYFKFKTYIKV